MVKSTQAEHIKGSHSHPEIDPAWRSRVSIGLLGLLILWPILIASEFKPWILFDAQSLQVCARFLISFFPPAHDVPFLRIVLSATWQTIAIATAGLSLALITAIPFSLLTNEQISISRLGTGRTHFAAKFLRNVIRYLLIILRSMPELVWALLLVRIVGLGATAGVLAIAFSYSGMLAKVYAEILESCPSHCTENLLLNGASRLNAFLYGSLPHASHELLSYTIYRWECAIRGSAVMGFVGAGGLGQRMDESMKMLSGAEVSSMLIVFVGLVAMADVLSKFFRKNME